MGTKITDMPNKMRSLVMAKMDQEGFERAAMNKTEAAFARWLQEQQLAGQITRWRFEPMKLRLAKNTFYTPDFISYQLGETFIPEFADIPSYRAWQIVIYEVKGYWQDDARVKFKMAVELFPEFNFVVVELSKEKGQQFKFTPGDRL